ncbi:unnamed protein product [Protopolystoma xenopodis]|uniref:Guanylate kinase-like domain-containing protein n=1 Tax=Protopolystoma xenopodis TaxID=117903 RepID=A0A448X5V5_9PLAT|nr:unnamed protein product [Protopolystoma xenopodis]
MNTGLICILDVDLAGVKSIYAVRSKLNPRFIFIRPPSMTILEKRLRDRGTETEEKLQARISRANADIVFADSMDGKVCDIYM